MRRILAITGLMILLAGAARGQLTEVLVEIDADAVGVGGVVQPGQWAGLRLRMTNRSAELRRVVARWIVSDEDGDEVFAEREAPLNPLVTQTVWLYAPLPMTLRDGATWTVRVIDADSNRELAGYRIAAPQTVPLTDALLGVCASVDMGLRDYEPGYTQHEPTRFIRGLRLSGLPDRWYGLDALHALIWTDEGSDAFNDPTDASVTPQVVESLRQWVRRGGHLVIVLPLDQTWSDSPLADLMPVAKGRIRRVDDFSALRLGSLPPDRTSAKLSALTFDVRPGDGASVVAVDDQQRPYIVAGRYGFGRVTLVGVDLTHPEVRRLGLPNGQQRVWNRVFNWASPVITEQVYDSEVRENKMLSLMSRRGRGARLDDMVSGLIAMTGMAAPALLSAILVFALYWVLAGPVAYVYLRNHGRTQHAWLAFVILAGAFTAITWGGAWIMRPAHTKLEHVTVLDVDANTADVRVQSWLTLLVPEFGTATVALDGEGVYPGQTLASPGVETRSPGGEFLDPQQYRLDAADPRRVTIPVRSTAKRFTLDYLGKLDSALAGIDKPWMLPAGQVQMDDNDAWPVAKLTHQLPGDLTNVLVVYCPGTLTASGEVRPPWVGLVPQWPAGQTLELTSPPGIAMTQLVNRPPFYSANRVWEQEGYLGALIAQQKGRAVDPNQPGYVRTVTDLEVRQMMMLSFYDALPPPDVYNVSLAASLQAIHYERTFMRGIDLTRLLSGRRLILIGQLTDSPLPAPLTLDGESIPARGLTLVRWVYDL